MADDNLVIIRKVKDEWRVAPWNGGLGGPYAPLLGPSGIKGVLWEPDEPQAPCVIAELEADAHLVMIDIQQVLHPAAVTHKDGEATAHALDNPAEGLVPLPEGVPPSADEPRRAQWLDSLGNGRKNASSYIAIDKSGHPTWINDGGAAAWLEARHDREHRRRQHKQVEDQALQVQAHESGRLFINPYTFVPLPKTVERSQPRGHASMGTEGLSGWFDWKLDFVSPLVLPHDMPALTDKQVLAYPGSGLRGVLRSMHEILAHGCMRIMDADFIPIHREPMTVYNSHQYRLAVVDEVRAGKVRRLRLTEEPVWVRSDLVHAVIPAGRLVSGSRVTVDEAAAGRNRHTRRRELTRPGSIKADGDWVVHLSDLNTRNDAKAVYLPVGRLSDTYHTVTEAQWSRFQRAARGSADLIGNEGENKPADTSGFGPGHKEWPARRVESDPHGYIGRRRKVDGWLAVGDTVWLTRQHSTGDLKMAVIWRREGSTPVKDRLPPSTPATSHTSCADPGWLCPTCQLFGSVDGTAGKGGQSGYASHVRVGVGRSTAPVASQPTDLAPLRSPKPSSGGFYLRSSPDTPANRFDASPDEGHVPAAHWGSRMELANKPREIRGRKVYWHGFVAPGADPARQEPRGHAQKQLTHVQIVDTPLTLTCRVHFDNVSPAQLALLVAAAAPERLFGHGHKLALHVGGAKPFGFGSARTSVENLTVFTAATRYAGTAPATTDVDLDSLLSDAAAHNKKKEDQASVWAALEKALDLDAVPADRIWYPLPDSFVALRGAVRNKNVKQMKEIDKVFNWFGRNSGGRKGRLVELPDITSSPYIPIEGEA